MRQDFVKVFNEPERHGHTDSFKDLRKMKVYDTKDEDGIPTGGRESMRERYKYTHTAKHQQVNLSVLYRWIGSCVGKNWDKCYSELCSTAHGDPALNNIKQYIEGRVELHAKVIDGTVKALALYSGKGYVPISEGSLEFYVCPKDRTLKKAHKEPRKSYLAEREAQYKSESDKVFRVLDKDNHLHLIDGVWYQFTLKDFPPVVVEYWKPVGREVFFSSYLHQAIGVNGKSWEDLNQSEREKHGFRKVISGSVFDTLVGKYVSAGSNRARFGAPSKYTNVPEFKRENYNRYHDTKKTASHKTLKKAGIV